MVSFREFMHLKGTGAKTFVLKSNFLPKNSEINFFDIANLQYHYTAWGSQMGTLGEAPLPKN